MSDKLLSELTEQDYELARMTVEDELIDWRDRGMFTLRANGLTVRGRDGSDSNIIRFGFEMGMKMAVEAILKRNSS